jgi:hypothetical protein
MSTTPKAPKSRVRPGIALVAGLLAVTAMAVMFVFDSQLKAKGRWVPYLLAAPIYILLQLFAEGILESFWLRRSWIAKAFPILAVLLYYALWLAIAS